MPVRSEGEEIQLSLGEKLLPISEISMNRIRLGGCGIVEERNQLPRTRAQVSTKQRGTPSHLSTVCIEVTFIFVSIVH
jgi:hypothetical protein